ncbi:hypothetical protein MMC19_003424 [Ptychographa xylographoides]|nr:hypothetical protein [Ptychographa xylographoides]
MQSLEDFMGLLSFLPNEWTDEGINNLEDNPGHDQQIPAEAPLELVVQIFLNLRDDLHGPGYSNLFRICKLTDEGKQRERQKIKQKLDFLHARTKPAPPQMQSSKFLEALAAVDVTNLAEFQDFLDATQVQPLANLP